MIVASHKNDKIKKLKNSPIFLKKYILSYAGEKGIIPKIINS